MTSPALSRVKEAWLRGLHPGLHRELRVQEDLGETRTRVPNVYHRARPMPVKYGL